MICSDTAYAGGETMTATTVSQQCPFCRDWQIDYPYLWPHFAEIEDLLTEHLRECPKITHLTVAGRVIK